MYIPSLAKIGLKLQVLKLKGMKFFEEMRHVGIIVAHI